MLKGLWVLNLKISNFYDKMQTIGIYLFCLQHSTSLFFSQFLIFFILVLNKEIQLKSIKWEPGFIFWKLLWLSFKSQNYKRIMGSK